MNIYTLILVFLLGVGTFAGITYVGKNYDTADQEVTKLALENETENSVPANPESANKNEPVETKSPSMDLSSYIDLHNKGLTSVPKSIFDTVNATALNLSGNRLSGSLPAEVRFLKNLQTLDLSNNNFTGVPAEIGQLQKLEILDLSGNPITGLPYELGNLTSLKVLNLKDTQYSKQDLDIIKKSLPADTVIYTSS